jgi:hypothetical protein
MFHPKYFEHSSSCLPSLYLLIFSFFFSLFYLIFVLFDVTLFFVLMFSLLLTILRNYLLLLLLNFILRLLFIFVPLCCFELFLFFVYLFRVTFSLPSSSCRSFSSCLIHRLFYISRDCIVIFFLISCFNTWSVYMV